MGTKTLMSVDEYLHTSFDGADREYLDGEAVERNMGNKGHSRAQGRFVHLFSLEEDRTGLYVLPELRHRLTANRFRIPDVAVFEGEPAEQVPSSPPFLAIEVLSPDDRVGYIVPKLEELRQWGVPNIWVADPEDRKLFTYGPTGLHEVASLTLLPKYSITFTREQIFGDC
jgi:Uma2 family endonuclease